jgi:hypothetical protein
MCLSYAKSLCKSPYFFHVPVFRHFRTIWLITPTQISSEGQESWNKIWYRNFFFLNEKSSKKTVPVSAAYALTIHVKYVQFLLLLTAEDISIYHKLKHKKHPCKPVIANDFKLHETNWGKGSTNEGVQYYCINIVLSVKLKKIIIEKSEVISLHFFSLYFHLNLPWFTCIYLEKISANVGFFLHQCNALFWTM